MGTDTFDNEELRLLQEVRTAILSLGYVKLRSLDCSCVGKTIKLVGTTDSFYIKQIALAAAQKVSGVDYVIDQIVVAKNCS